MESPRNFLTKNLHENRLRLPLVTIDHIALKCYNISAQISERFNAHHYASAIPTPSLSATLTEMVNNVPKERRQLEEPGPSPSAIAMTESCARFPTRVSTVNDGPDPKVLRTFCSGGSRKRTNPFE